jgi:FKBP-type peptidyl-prolyl cis-trans isomerase
MLRLGFVLAALTLLLAPAQAAARQAPRPQTAPAPVQNPALSAAANAAYLRDNTAKPGVVTRPSGLQYRILHNGFGMRPRAQDYVTVYYTGKLIDGMVFDGTEEGMPARFKVNSLIPGWAEALTLMRVGDRWQIVIPANMGYGARGSGETIPPNQTLVFELELLKVVPPRMRPHAPDENPDKVDDNEDLGPDDGK